MAPYDIAIVGIGCRFPGGSDSPDAFWRLLCDGVDAITEIPADRLDLARFFDPDPAASGKMYTRWGGYVDGVDLFDAGFFGFSPREATRIDPQHRLLLELTGEALEDAGIPADGLAGSSTGVFVGVSTHDYGDIQMYPANRSLIDAHSNSGVAGSIAANRVSYAFDLRGPSMVVDTACSSSLTAVHLASRALQNGECDVALAGGAQLILTPEVTIGFCKAAMISPDGRCRAFDAAGNGYVRSEGAGLVVLKPLEAALVDGDRIYAVLAGSAVNQDGRTNGMTVPSAEAQASMLRDALQRAEMAPGDVDYVEAHGTGTPVGDPLEAAGLGAVFAADRAEPLAIGSVKSNIGHLEAASGIAGLVKAALVLHHGQLPPSIHFHEPSPGIDFEQLRLRVVTELEPMPTNGRPPAVTVNSFGFGGANAAIVLRGAPEPVEPDVEPGSSAPELLVVSARSAPALEASARAYLDLLAENGEGTVRATCAAVARRRAHHERRVAVVGNSTQELIEGLDAFLAGERRANLASGHKPSSGSPPLAFVFSGMGPQWWGMGRELWEQEPAFRSALEACDAALEGVAPWSLLEELLRDEATSRVGEADLAQVTNFAIQVALADLWAEWGIKPDIVIGHSAGEIAAAHVSGALDLHDAALLAYHRSRLQARATGKGKMLAAAIDRTQAAEIVEASGGSISLAAVNAPASVTLSGDADALEELRGSLDERQVFARMLQVAVPYHSAHMDQIRDELLESLASLSPKSASVPQISVVTGEPIDGAELGGAYWWRNIRQPVLFADGIEHLAQEEYTTFLELGPHPVLASSVAECLGAAGVTGTVLPSIRRQEDERAAMLRSLGALYAAGRSVDWASLYGDHVPHLDLPQYPWQRERHWFEPSEAAGDAEWSVPDGAHPLLGRRVRGPRAAWEGRLAGDRFVWLDDHRVQGTVPFPGVGYVEMGLACAREVLDVETPALRDVDFRKALFVTSRDSTLVQISVDSDTLRFEVHGNGNRGEGEWALQADGQLGVADMPDERRDLMELKERCAVELGHHDVYEQLGVRGFDYGPAFQGIEQLWQGEDEVIAKVRLGELPSAGDPYEIHPALFDAALQTVIVAAESSFEKLGVERQGFLPVHIDEVRLHHRPGTEFWVYARAVDFDGDAFEGEVEILDDSGEVLVAVRGLRSRRLDSAQDTAETIDDWLYEYRWEPVADTEALTDPDALAKAVGWAEYYDAIEPPLNAAAGAFALDALRELGWRPSVGDPVELDTLATELAIGEPRRRFLGAVLGGLAGNGVLEPDGNGWRVADLSDDDAMRILDGICEEHPAYELDCSLLARCGKSLAPLLRGDADAVDLLFSEEMRSVLTRFYAEAPTARFYNALLAEAAAAFGAERDGDGLRVLEIGAGTGGTTFHVLPRLPADRTSYMFTDVSPHFAVAARERFPGVETATFDLELPPAGQGFEAGSYDLVVAGNVLHSTRDLRSSLAHVRELLAPGGALLMLEITRRPFWLDLVFGPTDGWWRFEDRELRPEHALLDKAEWTSLLAESGFDHVEALHDSPRDGVPGQSVLMGRAPVATNGAPSHEAASWLVLADRNGVGEELAARLPGRVVLAQHGEAYDESDPRRLVVRPDSDEDLARAVAAASSPAAVVHLWSLDAPSTDELDGRSLLDAQREGSGSVLALLRALGYENLPERGLVLVTAGGQDGFDPEALEVAQAPLWGLGRVIFKERPELRCRMVELGPAPGPAELDALVREVVAPGNEEELSLRNGRRFARRLRRTEAAVNRIGEPRSAGAEDPFRLEIETPGALESLFLREVVRRQPGPGEVELRVAAASVNFRDVMLALGVLPRWAVDGIVDGEMFGLDCAGTVVAVGSGVEHLLPGDEVLATGLGSLGSYLTTKHAVKKPSSLSFEEAATVPIAFLTATIALARLARLAPGETVLVHSATGGVGLAAIQVARAIGAEVIATAGSEEKRAHLRSLGIEHVYDSRSLEWVEGAMGATGGRGVDVVLNSLSGKAIEKGIGVLAASGRFIEIGKSDVAENPQIGLLAFRRNLSYFMLEVDRLGDDDPAFVEHVFEEVADKFLDGTYEVLPYTTFSISETESALRLMAQARHQGKIVVRIEGEPAEIVSSSDVQPALSGGSYLITGGLGGFGLGVARRLVDDGAGTIVLTGRSDPGPEAVRAIHDMEAAGARIEVILGDISRSEDVRALLARIRKTLPPLRGIVHGAMVLDDAPLEELNCERFDRTLAAKAAGAWNLHLETAGDELEFFVLFSSIAGLFGNAQQGNYAAANAFLDALAHHRRALGLPALSINWGVLSGTGYVSRHDELGPFLARQGYLSFTLEQALETFSVLLREDRPQLMASRIDWGRLAVSAPVSIDSLRLRHFRPEAGAAQQSVASAPNAYSEILSGPPEELPERLQEYLRSRLGGVLGVTAEGIDVDRPLIDMGLDSLIAVELRTLLKNDLGVELPVVQLLGGITVAGLAELLVVELPDSPETTGAVQSSPPLPAPPEPEAQASEPAPSMPVEPEPEPISARTNGDRPDYRSLDYSRWTRGQRVARGMLGAGLRASARIRTEGLEHLPPDGGFILATNHLSMADVPVLLSVIERPTILVATSELRAFPWLEWFLSDLGKSIWVGSEDGELEALESALEVVESGGVVGIGPEGRRSATGGLEPGKPGAVYVATRGGVPVVPVATWGQERLGRSWRRLRRAPVEVRFGAPLHFPAGEAGPADLRAYTDQLMHEIARMLPPKYRGVYADAVS